MATVDVLAGADVLLKKEVGDAAWVEAMFVGLAKGAASRQVVAAAAAAVVRCVMEQYRGVSKVEVLVQDRLDLIAHALRAQVAEGLASGAEVRSAANLVTPGALLRANAAKHQGFDRPELISAVPERELRRRQRGRRRTTAIVGCEGERFKEQVAEEEAMRQVAVEKAAVQQAAEEVEAELKKQAELKAKQVEQQIAEKVLLQANKTAMVAKVLAENLVAEAKLVADALLARGAKEAILLAALPGSGMMTGQQHWEAKVLADKKVADARVVALLIVTAARKLAVEVAEEAAALAKKV
jgi:hypothetical protein